MARSTLGSNMTEEKTGQEVSEMTQSITEENEPDVEIQ